MSKDKGITWYDEPRVMYLREKDYRRAVKELKVTGETSRSWVSGRNWAPTKWAKNDHEQVDEAAYRSWLWDCKNRYAISNAVNKRHSVTSEQLRAIADLIGYKEQP